MKPPVNNTYWVQPNRFLAGEYPWDLNPDKGKMPYVHCWGGIGRTGTVVGCWLARHGGGGEDALNQLKQLWTNCTKSAIRNSPETDEQENFILNWRQGQ